MNIAGHGEYQGVIGTFQGHESDKRMFCGAHIRSVPGEAWLQLS